jgi:receptor expression-enhancing protein 5/6
MSQPSLYSAQGVQVRAKKALKGLDGELSKFTYANEFERKTGVPKTYVALGVGSIGLIMIFFNLAGQFLTNLIAWAYPGMHWFHV